MIAPGGGTRTRGGSPPGVKAVSVPVYTDMPGCHAATMTTCDSRADFGTCPCCGYSAAGESSRLLYKLIAIFVAAHVLLGYSTVVADVLQPIEKHGGICECLSSRGALLDASQSRTKLSGM